MSERAAAGTKPRLGFFQIWNMCFGFLGIQIGFGLQTANVSRIFQTLGAEIDALPILWIAAPLTGLLVQPIVGYLSDRTWGPLGRRRPYFAFGAVATTIALIAMPNSPSLWIAAGMLWIMDASINVTMEPFRAFVGDNLPHRQRTAGFAMQSFFIGAGAVFASALPWMLANWFGVDNTAAPGIVPDSVKIAFYVGASGIFLAVMWTVLSTREYPPEELAAFEEAEKIGAPPIAPETAARRSKGWGIAWLVGGAAGTLAVWRFALDKELYIVGGGAATFGLILLARDFLRDTDNPFTEIIDDLLGMPRTMRQLAVVQFFSWFALFSMWIYAIPGVTEFHYGTSDPTSEAYARGAEWVGILFAVYNGIAALVAISIPVLADRIGRKGAHAINLALGGLGLASFLVIAEPQMLWIGMIGVGFAWASILSVPYAILSGALPAKKMGVYMGIFNFFIVIPQVLAASILGVFVRYLFAGEAIYALGLGAVSLFLAAGATLLVTDRAEARTALA